MSADSVNENAQSACLHDGIAQNEIYTYSHAHNQEHLSDGQSLFQDLCPELFLRRVPSVCSPVMKEDHGFEAWRSML